MAGSGVNASNILELQHLGIDAAHFSIRKKTGEKVPLGMGEHYEPDEEKIIKILNVLKR
jgi:copper homeostasis protein CutC